MSTLWWFDTNWILHKSQSISNSLYHCILQTLCQYQGIMFFSKEMNNYIYNKTCIEQNNNNVN